MTTIKNITKKVKEYCQLSGYDLDVLKENDIDIQRCDNKKEMDEEGVDYSFPYILNNPYNLPTSLP